MLCDQGTQEVPSLAFSLGNGKSVKARKSKVTVLLTEISPLDRKLDKTGVESVVYELFPNPRPRVDFPYFLRWKRHDRSQSKEADREKARWMSTDAGQL